jgi:small-conductance mechanosensitive channel
MISLLTKKTNLYYFLLITIVFISHLSFGQSNITQANDSLKPVEKGFFSIPEIDYEISKIDNYLDNTSNILKNLNDRLDHDTTNKNLMLNIEKEAKSFNEFEPETLSKFFLENSYRIWRSYETRLNSIQSEYYDLLKSSEKRNKNLASKEITWEKTAQNTKKFPVPASQVQKIKKIQKRINQQHNDNYKFSLRIINYESNILDQQDLVAEMLSQIEKLQEKYRKELLHKTGPFIWQIYQSNTKNKSFITGIKQAWYDNTKYLRDNYNLYAPSSREFIILGIFILFIHFLLRKSFVKDSERSKNMKDINLVAFQNPLLSAFSTLIFLFFIVFTNLPLALSEILAFLLLLVVYATMKNYISTVGGTILKKIIILSFLNNLEIIVWYFGDAARILLLLESGAGILLMYPYIRKDFTVKILPHLRFRRVIHYLRFPIVFAFIISFIANIAGYVNLSIYLQKISIQMTVLIFLVFGIWNIFNSFIMGSIDILNRNKNLKIYKYVPLIKKRLLLVLNIFLAYILINNILSLFEIKHAFYQSISDFFSISRQIGSIQLSFGDIAIFIIVLSSTWGINSLIKIVFDEENYRSYNSVRGIPAAISMTLRVLFTSVGIFFAFSAAGFNMKSFSMIVGALSVGIGFGLQNVVNDYISGLILIYERPVQKGDVVEVNNLMGEVIEIGIRRSTVRTFDGAEVIIPNANLTSNQLTNWTLSDKQKRLDIRIGVSYGSNPLEVKQILKEVAEQHPLVLNMPAPKVLFNEFNDSAINFRLLCWVSLENGIQVKSDLYTGIFEAFEKHGVEIPFPQMDIHVKNEEPKKTTSLKENPDNKED